MLSSKTIWSYVFKLSVGSAIMSYGNTQFITWHMPCEEPENWYKLHT